MGFTGGVKTKLIAPEDTAALTRWFGGDSAPHVIATLCGDWDEGAEEIMDGLREPTFAEYGQAKRAAREAAERIIAGGENLTVYVTGQPVACPPITAQEVIAREIADGAAVGSVEVGGVTYSWD